MIQKIYKNIIFDIQGKEKQEEKYDRLESIYSPSHFNEDGLDRIPERIRRL